MKTYQSPYLFKKSDLPRNLKIKTGFTIFWKEIVYAIAFLIFSFSLSAQVSVTASLDTTGPTTYGSLKLAFDAINNGTHIGVITLSITGSTTETVTAVLNASGSGAANYASVKIQPSGGSRTVSGVLAASLIDLNGADNITIDGLNTGGNSLTIENTSATSNTCTIRYLLDAGYNTIQNCTIKGSGTSNTFGTILFSTASSTGNSNNIIAGNNISCSGANLPLNAIASLGTATSPNTAISISNNKIYNYTIKGIDVSATGSGNWTISGNSFYKEAGIFDTYNPQYGIHAIRILGGTGYNILNNYIGGEGSHLSGNNAIYNAIGILSFTGIYLASSAASPASYIKGNTISKLTINCVNTAAPLPSGFFSFNGIETAGSGINVGGSLAGEGNTIGSGVSNGAISLSTSTASANPSSIYGIYFHSSGGLITGNQVAGIDISNAGSSPAPSDFRGIYVSIAVPPSQVNNNTIGSTTTSNSVRVMATSTATGTNLTGIYLGSTISSALSQVNGNTIQNITHLSPVSSGSFTGINTQNGYVQSYQNNTIKNIYAAANSSASSLVYTGILSSTSLSPSTVITNNTVDNIDYRSSGTAARIRGMEISGSSPKVTTINSNTFSNLTSFSQKSALGETDDPSSFTIIGLLFSTGGTSSVIFNNNFYNFSSLTTANINTVVAGLAVTSPGGGNIYGNRFSSFSNSATGSINMPCIVGIKAFKGSFNVYNNSIKISNTSFTNGPNIYGILQNTAGTSWTYFHNTIAVSGTNTSSNVARTAAFIRTTEGGLLIKNNVFVNTRTGAGAHYAISNIVASPSASWLSTSGNYNNLYSSNPNTPGEWGIGISNTFPQWQSNSGGEANSVSRQVSFIVSDYDLHPIATSNCILNNAGMPITTPVVINRDLNNTVRSGANPDLGAYEYDFILPGHSASNNGAKCIGENIALAATTGTGDTPFTYTWTGPNLFTSTSQNPVITNVTAPMNGKYTVTVTDANGCSGDAETTAMINALPAGTLTSDVGPEVSTGSPVVFTGTDGSSYNFTINGNSVQNNASPTYTTSNLNTGNIVGVIVTSTNGCTATYPGIAMIVSGVMVNGKTYIKWNGTKIKKWNGIKKVN